LKRWKESEDACDQAEQLIALHEATISARTEEITTLKNKLVESTAEVAALQKAHQAALDKQALLQSSCDRLGEVLTTATTDSRKAQANIIHKMEAVQNQMRLETTAEIQKLKMDLLAANDKLKGAGLGKEYAEIQKKTIELKAALEAKSKLLSDAEERAQKAERTTLETLGLLKKQGRLSQQDVEKFDCLLGTQDKPLRPAIVKGLEDKVKLLEDTLRTKDSTHEGQIDMYNMQMNQLREEITALRKLGPSTKGVYTPSKKKQAQTID
jgi:hypothetical protein